MDPLSIAGSVVGLTATCLQTAKALHDLKDRFKYADITIAAICTETTIISVSLSRIQSSMLTDASKLGEKLQEGGLSSTLDAALTGCYVVFDVLQSEINKLTDLNNMTDPEPLKFKGKAKLIWNESLMQELLGQLRGLQTSLTLLLQLLTTDTMTELKQMMDVNVTVLSKVVERTRRFRSSKQSQAPESIFDMSFTTLSIHQGENNSVFSNTMFQFDDQIINSQAYRRTLARAYAAINERSEEDTVKSSNIGKSTSQGTDETDSVTSVGSSHTALDSNIAESSVRSPENGEVPTEISDSEESMEKFLNFKSIYTVWMPEWAEQWKMGRQEISGVPKEQVERQFMIHEVVQTERRYLKQLLVLRYLYKHRWLLTLGPERWDTTKITNGFPGGEEIFQVNKKHLYEPLLARQASQGPWILSIADIFEHWVSLSAPAYLDYAKKFTEYHESITSTARNNAAFSHFLDQARNRSICERLDWTTYLKAPMDRLQRYILLLEVILKSSDKLNPALERDRMQNVISSLRSCLADCDAVISQDRKSMRIERLNSRIVSVVKLIPPDAEILLDMELKLKRRTLDSSIPIQLIMYRSKETLKVFLFRYSASTIGPEGTMLELHDTVRDNPTSFHKPSLLLFLVNKKLMLAKLEDLASFSYFVKGPDSAREVKEVKLESNYKETPWRLSGFLSQGEFENFAKYMKLLMGPPKNL